MRRAGFEYAKTAESELTYRKTEAILWSTYRVLDAAWENRDDEGSERIRSRLAGLEQAYWHVKRGAALAEDDETRVVFFVLGAKIMHDISEQCDKYSLQTANIEDADLEQTSLAWLGRAQVITSQQDRFSGHHSAWRPPLGETISREAQLEEIKDLQQQYRGERPATEIPQPLAPVIELDPRVSTFELTA